MPLDPFTIIPQRHIGPFVAQATIEEDHRDDLIITRHPVEQGAAITDHVYKAPAEVVITAGWTPADPNGGGDESYLTALYGQLLQLQASGVRFDIVTGKRVYTDMLFRELAVKTDQKTENTLWLRAVCQQIIIVSTQTFTVPPAANQADPSKNAPVVNTGGQQLQPTASYIP